MAEQALTDISSLLNEEKWTRATLNNYTVNNFKELDEVIEQVREEGRQNDVLAECEEHLQHTKNSIIALYISGILHISRQAVNDTNLVTLINIFADNHKWNIVAYLANRILEFGENKAALRTLADCYNNENQLDAMYDVWERLIRVDFDEADIVRRLAERKEELGETEQAIDYYKKALHRYINKKAFNNLREVWHKLIHYAPDETEFFYHAESKIAKTISPDRSSQLLEELYPHFKNTERWDTAIELLKRILNYDSKNPFARKEIVECYRSKYSHHSHLEEYIKLSNLNQSWRNIHDAITDFEKHISFDAGNFVYHRAWGVGIIRSIDDDSVMIDFARKRGHSMSLKMAVSSLDILAKDHLWVLKSIWKKEKLRKKVKSDVVWTLRTVIKSCGNAADIKRIKSELVPSILTPNEWTAWSTKARNELKTNQEFGNLTDKPDHYMVREQPITFEEKTFNKFKAERSFFDRVKTIDEFLEYIEQGGIEGTDSQFFREMFDYFVGFLRSVTTVNEYTISSLLLVKRIVARFPYLHPGDIELQFVALYEQISDLEDIFRRIENSDIRKEFLQNLRRKVSDWPDRYVQLFPYALTREIITELERAGHVDKLHELFHRMYSNYRDQREPYIWIVRNCFQDPWFQAMEMPFEKVLISMIHLLDITYRDIDNKRDTTYNRKLNRQIHNFLFKDRHVARFLSEAEEASLTRIYTLVSDVKDLDPSIRIELKQIILDRFPNFKFYGERETETVSRGFITTPRSFEAKQKHLQHIQEVDVPENSKEISAALALGDLKENAEYKAAKERQDFLNSTAARLKEELETAEVMRPDEVKPGAVSFGTRVQLKNNRTGETETYTILGPWESNPEEAVISYLSPLGSKLYNHVPGDHLQFEINERTYDYVVEQVETAEF